MSLQLEHTLIASANNVAAMRYVANPCVGCGHWLKGVINPSASFFDRGWNCEALEHLVVRCKNSKMEKKPI